ncbi:isochorismate synthase [Halobacteriales archaeon QS_1_68_20]|nr:MAG: isochorismate synthase [Halobacteriales archaeon QS_1_68_20]
MDTPRRDGGAAVDGQGRTLVSRSRRISDVSFSAFLADREAPRVRWTAPDGTEIAAAGSTATVTADGQDRFETVRERADRLLADVDVDGPAATRPRLFGGFAFHADHEPAPPWEGFPAARFVLPRVQLTRTADETWLTVTSFEGDAPAALEEERDAVADLPSMRAAGDPPGVDATRRTTPREEWTRMIEHATERIAAGGLRKVTLATALSVELARTLPIPEAVERLRRTYPDCYRFLIQPTDGPGFFGAPPERLVRLDGQQVGTEALAGSVARGETPEEDAALADTLRDGEKLREEHEIVVDAIREWLAPFGEVTVGDRAVRKLSNIQHLRTPISATLSGDAHVLSLVEALHPTPAVGGLPRDTALALIRETEAFERGWYASPVGWFDAAGDGEFTVAIRSAVADGRRATLFAGNGIVADSDPDEEWAEVQPKFRPVLDELEADADE